MKRDPERELSAVESLLWFAAAVGGTLTLLGLAAAVILAAMFASD